MEKKKTDSSYWWRHLSYGLIAVILAGGLIFTGVRWYHNMRANQLVRECRNVWLSCRLVGIGYYGQEDKLLDEETASGLTAGAELEVIKKSKCEGVFRILKWNREQTAPQEMLYVSDPYVVEFRYGDGVRSWKVYRKEQLLTLDAQMN